MRAVGHTEKYPEFAMKPCPACLERTRERVTLKPWFVRSVDSDQAFITYQCPRCIYVDDLVVPVDVAVISRPCGEFFKPRAVV